MADNLKLSVVMATYNRAETLRQTLRHLADQDLDPSLYEVIVIDDGSPDDTRSVVQEAMGTVPFQLSYLHHTNHGPGYTQNRGLEVAKAPVVLLMADDIMMQRRTLSSHLAYHDAHPEMEAAVLGRVIQDAQLNHNVFMRTWDPFRFSDFAGHTELPYFRFWACNISVKRDFILRFGPFREARGRAGPAAHEDPELGYRLNRHGLRIFYCPQALGHHHHVVSLQQACSRAHHQGLNFGEFNTLVPEPEIPVVYHVISRQTVGDHLRAWFGPGRRYLSPGDRNPVLLLARYLVRDLVFNTITVRKFWEPLLERAEKDPSIARHMRPAFYRGLIAYYFFRGCREGNQRFGAPQLQRA